MTALTVVIPTYNRFERLQRAIAAYLDQSALQGVAEIIVVDDGSTDSTAEMVARTCEGSPVAIRYFRQENKGPAAARNVGIREAHSELILFTDDDIVPERGLVAQHLAWHQQNPELSTAVLGYVTWPPQPRPTPFMKWYGEHKLFSYGRLQHGQEVERSQLFTSNVSLKANFLRTFGQFDEDFKTAAYEDIELAYRLRKSGLRLLYNSHAVAYHHQSFLFAEACSKARANAAAARVFLQKEAGKHLLEPRIRRRSRLWFRTTCWLAIAIATALKPARRLLDSYVPLPRIIYDLFLWYDGTRLVGIPNLELSRS
jgi:GT2 family glycosyltransferase